MTAGQITWTSRALLVAAIVTLATLMLGPFSGLEHRFLLGDKQAHALAFYGATALSFLAFPRRRRNDLCLIALALGAMTEIGQAFTGRDIEISDIAADAVGVFALMIPIWIEQIRAQHRANPWMPLLDPVRRPDRRSSLLARRPTRAVGVKGKLSPTAA